ncbi:MAG: porin [Burkholderiales bacterium]|nr:porin [Burkholderiales bacterium]
MKFRKVVGWLGIIAASKAACAAEIELYGTVDTFVAVNYNGSYTSVQFGSGGLKGSLYGIRGKEDLGGGTNIFFRLENGFISSDGTNTTVAEPDGWAFQREAVLGIRNEKWGTFSFGRLYSLNAANVVMFDPYGLTLGSVIGTYFVPNGVFGMTGFNGQATVDNLTRRNNAFQYTSPSLLGWSFSAQVSLGEQKKWDGEVSNTLGNSYAVQAMYRKGNFAFASTWTLQNMASTEGFIRHNTNNNQVIAAASYDFSFTKLYLAYLYKHGENSEYSYNPTLQLWTLSSATPLWGGKLLAGFAYLHNNTVRKANSWNLTTRYEYPLSRSTILYGGLGFVNNSAKAMYQITAGGGGSASPLATMGKNYWTAFSGLAVSF